MAAGEGVDLIHQIGAGKVLSVLACVTMATRHRCSAKPCLSAAWEVGKP
jgi:hypothetical protein